MTNTAINPGSLEQPYRQIAREIRTRIRSGELEPGDKLPTSPALAQEWDVSRQTVQRALDVLRVEGLISARRGAGSFVRQAPTRLRRVSRARYARARKTHYRLGLANESQETLSANREQAPPDVSSIYGLDEGTEMVARRRRIFHGDQPVEVSVSWLRVKDVGGEDPETRVEPLEEALFIVIEKLTRRRYTYARDVIIARGATPEEADLLRIRPDTHVLTATHIAYDEQREPLEVVCSAWPEDRIQWIDEYAIPQEGQDVADPSEV